MIHSWDGIVLTGSMVGFAVFLVGHVILLRYFQKSISVHRVMQFALALGSAPGFCAALFQHPGLGVSQGVLLLAVIFLIYLLLVFHYLSLVFGMGEASIRIRLLRELGRRAGKSASRNEILEAYNAERCLDIRLSRLTRSGYLRFDGKSYRIRNPILLFQYFIVKCLKRLMGLRNS